MERKTFAKMDCFMHWIFLHKCGDNNNATVVLEVESRVQYLRRTKNQHVEDTATCRSLTTAVAKTCCEFVIITEPRRQAARPADAILYAVCPIRWFQRVP